jgi:hypothetical protein
MSRLFPVAIGSKYVVVVNASTQGADSGTVFELGNRPTGQEETIAAAKRLNSLDD